MRHLRRLACAAIAAVLGLGLLTPTAAAADPLPPGWAVAIGAAGPELVWTAPAALPTGDARIEVMVGDQALRTVVRPGGRTVRAALPAGLTPAVAARSGLAVLAAGRRLDAPAPAAAPGPAAAARDDAGLDALLRTYPLADTDPLRSGGYPTTRGEYGAAGVDLGYAAPVELRGLVVAPVGATGRRPLVVILHGRHAPCYRRTAAGAENTVGWPCPAGFASLPSYRGYVATQELLASQGYVTVSISANGINGQDWISQDGGADARAELLAAHLRLWTRWSVSAAAFAQAPTAVRAGAPADVTKVLLVGHSRGGEGVNRAAIEATTTPGVPWRIAGLVHLGPTSFGKNTAPGVPATVLLPDCDGDVYDLQGESYLDAGRRNGTDPALRSSVLVLGANHNYFNTEWTPGLSAGSSVDDWSDPSVVACSRFGPHARLTPDQQQQVGALYVAAAAAAFLDGSAAATALLDGSAVRPRTTRARVLVHALGGRRATVLLPTTRRAPTATGPVAATLCRGLAPNGVLGTPTCADGTGAPVVPHFLPLITPVQGQSARQVVDISWTAPGGAARVPLADSGTAADLSRAAALHLRAVAVPGLGSSGVSVRLVDASGATADLPGVPLPAVSDPALPGAWLARELRFPLAGAAVDLRRVVALEVVPQSGRGRLWLLDAWGFTPGLSAQPGLVLPRVDALTNGRVPEGSTRGRVEIPFRVTPAPTAPLTVRVFVAASSGDGGPPTLHPVTVAAGQTTFTVPVAVDGDTRDDYDEVDRAYAVLQSTDTAVAGSWLGEVVIVDDDPPPTAVVERLTDRVTEGSPAQWRIRLSAVSDRYYPLRARLVAPDSGEPEVDGFDVPPWWLAARAGLPPSDRPLSSADPYLGAELAAGRTTTVVTVPTRADGRVEGDEQVVLSVGSDELSGLDPAVLSPVVVADP